MWRVAVVCRSISDEEITWTAKQFSKVMLCFVSWRPLDTDDLKTVTAELFEIIFAAAIWSDALMFLVFVWIQDSRMYRSKCRCWTPRRRKQWVFCFPEFHLFVMLLLHLTYPCRIWCVLYTEDVLSSLVSYCKRILHVLLESRAFPLSMLTMLFSALWLQCFKISMLNYACFACWRFCLRQSARQKRKRLTSSTSKWSELQVEGSKLTPREVTYFRMYANSASDSVHWPKTAKKDDAAT